MAKFEAKKFNLSDINLGQRYENGQVLSADTINKVVEAAAYAQQIEAADEATLKALSASLEAKVDKEVNALSDKIPLLAYAPYNSQLSYQELLEHYNNKTNVLAHTSDFSKTPKVGEEFSALIKTSENYVTSIKGEITAVDEVGGYVSYKIISFVRLHSEDTYLYSLAVHTSPSSDGISISFYSTEDKIFVGNAYTEAEKQLKSYLSSKSYTNAFNSKQIYGIEVNENGEPVACYIGIYYDKTKDDIILINTNATVKVFTLTGAYSLSYSSKEVF